MSKIDNVNALISQLQNVFDSDIEKQKLDNAIHLKKGFSKWTCYSDYCFGDVHKPNDAISFVLIPFESEEAYQETEEFIKTKQSKDLKEVKTVNSDFLAYLKSNEIISFAYILDDFAKWLGQSKDEQREGIKECLLIYKKQFDQWNASEQDESMKMYYKELSTQIDSICSNAIKDKEINTYIELLLVAIIGAVTMSEVAKRLDIIEILGWFSDRDAILDKGQGLVCNIFHATLFCVLRDYRYKFTTYKLNSSNKPFFDNLNRISDIITGTLADYDIHNNSITNKKMGKVLREYFADNDFSFVHKLSFGEKTKISDIAISLTAPSN